MLERSEQIEQVTQKIIAVSKAIGGVKKAKLTGGVTYAYFSNESILSAVSEAMENHNLWVLMGSDNIEMADTEYLFHYQMTVVDGDSGQFITLPFTQAYPRGAMLWKDKAQQMVWTLNDKSTGIAHSYAHKTFLLKLFMISTPDADSEQQRVNNEQSVEPETRKQTPTQRTSTNSKEEPKVAPVIVPHKNAVRVSTIQSLLPTDSTRKQALLNAVTDAANDLKIVPAPTLDMANKDTVVSSLESLNSAFLDVMIEVLERQDIIAHINEQISSIATTAEEKMIQIATAAKQVDEALANTLLTADSIEQTLYYDLDMDMLHALESAVVLMVGEFAETQPKAKPATALADKIKKAKADKEVVSE